jgi:hypothetical protein
VSTATPSSSLAPPATGLPRPLRVTVAPDDYDALLALARRNFRRVEQQASYLLAQAVRAAGRDGATDAA